MPQATLSFSLPDEQYELQLALDARTYRAIIKDLREYLRSKTKHGHDYPSADAALEDIEGQFFSLLSESGIDLDK